MRMRLWQIWVLVVFIFFACTKEEQQPDLQIEGILEGFKVSGTFVLYDGKQFRVANLERAKERMAPASTFKIANALIAFSAGFVKSADDIFFHYKGEKLPMKSWKKDMSLREAVKVSNVYAFQQLVKSVGPTQMQLEIQKLRYGNSEIGENLDRFWIDGPLAISAVEQAEFLMHLAKNELPYTADIQEAVKSILLLEETSNSDLYGKTGLFVSQNQTPVGWFVGFVKEKESKKIYSFAFNMDIPGTLKQAFQSLEQRVDIPKAILKELGIL